MSKFSFGSYNIRPSPENKFKPQYVKQLIKYILNEELRLKEYKEEEIPILTNHLTNILLQKLKELNLEKYKFMVYIIIGEQRGQGLKMSSKCYWDSDTDYYVTETIVTTLKDQFYYSKTRELNASDNKELTHLYCTEAIINPCF